MTLSSESAADQKTVLVLGGRGFVGSHIVRALVAEGHQVALFGPPMEDNLLKDMEGKFTEYSGTVEDVDAIHSAIRDSRASLVVNTAAYSAGRDGMMRSGEAQSRKALEINLLGLFNLLEAALAAGVERVVWTSSTVVFGPSENYPQQPVGEEAPSDPETFYGLTKEMGEDLARYYRARHGLDVTALRLPLVVGPGLWYRGAASTIMTAVESARTGSPVTIRMHDELMDLMHVSDVARAVMHVLFGHATPDPAYNINGFTACMSDIVGTLAGRVGRLEISLEKEAAAMRFPLVSDARFRRAFAFEPAFGLDATITSLLEEGASHD